MRSASGLAVALSRFLSASLENGRIARHRFFPGTHFSSVKDTEDGNRLESCREARFCHHDYGAENICRAGGTLASLKLRAGGKRQQTLSCRRNSSGHVFEFFHPDSHFVVVFAGEVAFDQLAVKAGGSFL